MVTLSQSTQALTDSVIEELNVSSSSRKAVCLYSLHDALRRIDLDSREELQFGRLSINQFTLPGSDPKNICFFKNISKVHYVIKRRRDQLTGRDFYTLDDNSTHGTFVNKKRVPQPGSIVLQSGDTIGLHQRLALFLFFDERDVNDAIFPTEITSRYVVTRKLGAGACGEVHLVYERGSGLDQRYALKSVPKKKFGLVTATPEAAVPPRSLIENREVNILQRLEHPCIVGLDRYIETDDWLFIVMEYVPGGELFDRIVECHAQHKGMDESVAKVIFFQLLHAVAYLHRCSVTHRDLKPENVLLTSSDDESRVKLTDFGLAKIVDAKTMLRTFCGTPQYVAPEVLLTNGSGEYTSAIDCWSLGVMLFTMLGGYPPFSCERPDMSLRDQILKASYSFPARLWSSVSPAAIDLVRSLLTLDPTVRISANSALSHAWFDEETKQKATRLMGVTTKVLDELQTATCVAPREQLASDSESNSSSGSLIQLQWRLAESHLASVDQIPSQATNGSSGTKRAASPSHNHAAEAVEAKRIRVDSPVRESAE